MTTKKYNPAFLRDEELVQGFVVRHHELDTVLGVIRDNTGESNQHVLLIGPRGYGKSTLVLRAAIAVRREADLRVRWFPLVFAEESYQIGSVGEFWLEAVRRLAEVTGEARWRTAATELQKERDDARLEVRALGVLMDFADERGVRLLLVVENLDQVLGDQIDGKACWTLRKTLLAERRLMLLGTAVHRFEGIDAPDQAMFDLFRRIDIPALDARECDGVWASITGAHIGTRRAKPVRILCGGNPRLVVILAGFARERGLGDLLTDLDDLIDDHTEYFRQNIESLTGQLRRVFLALAEIWKPAPARLVAETARLPVNETSAALTRLVRQGRVVVSRTQGKNHYYQLAERLYNIYYLMRRHGGPEARVRALVEFLRYLYGPEQRRDVVDAIAREACTREEWNRAEHMGLLGHFLDANRRDPNALQEIIQVLPAQLLRADDLPQDAKKALKQPKALIALLGCVDGGEYLKDAVLVLQRRTRSGSTSADTLGLARAVATHPGSGEAELLQALSILLRAPEPEPEPLIDLYRRLLHLQPGWTGLRRGLAYWLRLQDRGAEALNVLEEGLTLAPDDKQLQRALGLTLIEEMDYERGVELLLRFAEQEPADVKVCDRLAYGLCQLGRFADAIAACETCLARLVDGASKVTGLRGLARTFYYVALCIMDPEKANPFIEALTSSAPEDDDAWHFRAMFEVSRGARQAALVSIERALSLRQAPKHLYVKAFVLDKLQRSEEAWALAEQVTRLEPSIWKGWNLCISIALRLHPEAVEALVDSALAATSNNTATHAFAATLFREGGGAHWPRALTLLEAHPHGLCAVYACLLGALRGPAAALDYVRATLREGSDHRSDTILRPIAMRVAAAGLTREMVEVLEQQANSSAMEPMIVALRRRLGDTVDAPIELVEVADEVNRRIDALAATNDIWRRDPSAIVLPDELDEPDTQIRRLQDS